MKMMIFVPMYNCQDQIVRTIRNLNSINLPKHVVVTFFDNISKDNTVSCATKELSNANFSWRVYKNDNNFGLGGSHKTAFQIAIKENFDYFIVLHGDDQGNIADFKEYIFSPGKIQHDCVLGSRFSFKSRLKGYSKFRIFGNLVFNFIYTTLSLKLITDLGAGLNLYNVKTLKDNTWINFPNDLTFNCVMLLHSVFKKHSIKFVPISWREEDQLSNVKLFRQSLKTLRIILKYAVAKKTLFHTPISASYTTTLVARSES